MEDSSPHIDIKEYGNIPDSSTTHYLVDLVDGVDKSGQYASLSAIDFTKVFDRSNHNVAVKKLIDIGVCQTIIPVICSFITNRTQAVCILGRSSSPLLVWGGVLQGTNFGPIIFSAVANDSGFDAPLRWKYVDDLTPGEIVCKDSTNKSQLQVDLDKLGPGVMTMICYQNHRNVISYT